MPSDINRVHRFFDRGLYFYQSDQCPDACVNLKDALQICPNFLAARITMALALAKQHKYVEAIKLLEEGRKQVPLRNDQNAVVLKLLGNICLVRQDYPAATYYLRAARKLDPKDGKLRLMLSTCYCKSGHYREGLDLLLESAHANP